MGFVNSSLSVGVSASTATIFNIILGPANTEHSQALPANTKEFIIKTRNKSVLKLSHVMSESGSKFITIPKTGVHVDTNLYTSETLYFQSPKSGDIVEIIAYT